MYRFDTSVRGIEESGPRRKDEAGDAERKAWDCRERWSPVGSARARRARPAARDSHARLRTAQAPELVSRRLRAFGYGSLYPCLKELLAQGLIAEEQPETLGSPLAGRRSKIVYRLTAEGKERLQQLLAEPGPAAWEDEGFGVRFAF